MNVDDLIDLLQGFSNRGHGHRHVACRADCAPDFIVEVVEMGRDTDTKLETPDESTMIWLDGDRLAE